MMRLKTLGINLQGARNTALPNTRLRDPRFPGRRNAGL